ncbi:MAG: TolC family protein, partial [Candidatus Latescibacteria bacterium]|nr:TolC family protein [Candidatus Latescibacterota bacterium]
VRDAADAQLREQQWEIALQVKKAYYDALLTRQVADIARLSLDQAERQLDHVQRQHQAGNLSDFDLLQAEVQRDNQVPEVVSADARHELALLNLKRLVNLPANTQVALTSGFLDPTMIEKTSGSLPALSALLQRSKGRPAIEAATFETAARTQAIKIARADLWPRLAVSSTYNRQAFPSGLFPKSGDWRTDWGVGVTMSLSVFDGLRTQAKVNEARANMALARERLAQVEETVGLTVEQTYWELNRARAQIDARQRTIGQAERALRLAELRYDQGISTQLEVADSRLQLQRARINHAQALHDYSVALVELERAAGINLSGLSTTLDKAR